MKFRSFGNIARGTVARAALGLALVAGLGALAAPAQAQQGAVTGVVVAGSTLQPLSGVQVSVVGTQLGALTDDQGRYRITGVPVGDAQIQARLIGYKLGTQTVTVRAGQSTSANFTLAVTAIALDEVIATIAGGERRREIGYATSSIDANQEVAKAKPNQVLDLIKGRATGVVVRQSSGSVGTGSDIRIRGSGSISLSNTPLFVVDGAIINADQNTGPGVGGQDASRLNDLDPSEIESIEIVKGPAASTLWGSASTSGVVRITTKKGRKGATRYTFRAEAGGNYEQGTDWPDSFFNPQAFFGPSAKDTIYKMNLLKQFDPFRNGLSQTYAASVRGGLEDVTYFLSTQYKDEEGTLPNNRFERFNLRGNLSITPNDKVNISVSNGFISNFLRLPDNDNNGFGYIGVALVGFPWNLPIQRSDPNTGGPLIDTCPINFEVSRLFGLPLAAVSGGCPDNAFFGGRTFDDVRTLVNRQDIERYTGSATIEYRPFDFLTNTMTVGYDQFSDRTRGVVPVNPDAPFGIFSQGDINKFDNTSRNLTMTWTSSLDHELTSNINSDLTAGIQYFKSTDEIVTAAGQVFPASSPTVGNSVTNQGGDAFNELRRLGFFFQEQLSWKDRLFLMPAIRFDDNSAFGASLGLQTYPRFSGSWVLSDEPGFPGFFDSFKLRGSWGKSGRQPGTNDALALLSTTSVTFQDADVLGFSPNRPGNDQLKPETGQEFEVGFDAGFLDGAITLEATYFNQKTSNAIVSKQLAPSLGFPGNRFTNIGEIKNSGVEIGIDWGALDRENVRWDWRLNVSTTDNEVTKLDQPIVFGFGSSQRHQEGLPFGSYFERRVIIDPATGDARVQTCAETPNDTTCDPDTNQRFGGAPNPDYEGSISTTLTLFNKITLFSLVDFQGGQQLFNSTEEFRCGFLGGGTNGGICPAIFETGPDGQLTDEAKIKAEAARIGSEAPWFEDASFAKLRTVSARFDLPRSFARRFGARSASISVVGENLATFTRYRGLDPEINEAGQTNAFRADFLTLPPQRRALATVSVTF
ncbi:MAG: SusC/RagA family TonB-linked outer membrane protein [Gemmatimonadota bacterium]